MAAAPLPDDPLRDIPGEVGSAFIVHLDRLCDNARAVRARVGARTVWAVVKADAYGLGAVPVATALAAAGCTDGFAVARLPEAHGLRAAGIEQPILILGPLPNPQPSDPGLHLSLGCREELVRARTEGGTSPLHVKIDTGMGRLGLRHDDPSWLADVAALGERVHAVWSHYSHADQPDHERVAAQQERLARVVERVTAALGRRPRVHLSNSGGLARLAPWEDAVRVGLYLYGVSPWGGAAPSGWPEPRDVVEWRTRIWSARELPAAHGISYGALYTTPAPTAVGVVPVGYADGLPAQPPGELRLWTARGGAPLRGRVTMDLSVVELPAGLRGGDDAWLLGPHDAPGANRTADLAAACGRIPYEVLTAVGRRVLRVYRP